MEKSKVFLIVGLGNPGREYVNTPHNVGRLVADSLVEKYEQNLKKMLAVQSKISKFSLNDQAIILLLPETFMNKSGLAVKKALQYWKIKVANLLVVQDDSDMPIGRIKLVNDQSAGGHRGIESIIQALGHQKFTRLKIGIRPAHLPQGGENHVKAEQFILRPMSLDILDQIAKPAVKEIENWLNMQL